MDGTISMDADEFFELVQTPGFGNEMVFQLNTDTPDPNRTFSREGIEATLDNVQNFVCASILRRFKETGEGPKRLSIQVSLKWSTESEARLEALSLPWWAAKDGGEAMRVYDGMRRIPRRPLTDR